MQGGIRSSEGKDMSMKRKFRMPGIIKKLLEIKDEIKEKLTT